MTESSEEESSEDEAPAKKAPPAKKGKKEGATCTISVFVYSHAPVNVGLGLQVPIW
jgi:hypothetical protein